MARDRSWVELIRIAAHLSDEAARYPPRDCGLVRSDREVPTISGTADVGLRDFVV